MELTDKTMLVTGASSGIGRAVVRAVAGRNNRLIVTARRAELLESLRREVEDAGSRCLVQVCDALDEEAAARGVAEAAASFGSVDAALLNIGEGPIFNMATASAAEVKENMRINYDSMVNYLVPLVAQMRRQGHGLIAHTNSLAGFLGLPMQGPYSAAKAAGRILFDACRTELRSEGIRMVSLHPGFVATERVRQDGIPAPFEISEDTAARHIIRGMERERADVLFPFALRWLIRLARILPKPVVGRVVSQATPKSY